MLFAFEKAEAKIFRTAGLYSTTSIGHFNCTCNQEAACMTNAVISQAKKEGIDISFKLISQDHNVFSTGGAAKNIASEKFDAVLGTLISTDALVAGEIFEKAGIPFIVPTATHPDVTAHKRFVTRVPFNDYRQANLLATRCGGLPCR